MKESCLDLAIIGAGFTGLGLATHFRESLPHVQIQILEKSKGCGGRVATRRINDLKFDHGAQFIERTVATQSRIQNWESLKVARKFPVDSMNAVCGQSGITLLPKALAAKLSIKYDYKVSKMNRASTHWELLTDDGLNICAHNVVITAPLPQSLDLLEKSAVIFDSKLKEISYSKALVVMVEFHPDFQPNFIFEHNVSAEIASVCAQHAKGNSQVPSWTVTMSPAWSEKYFDFDEVFVLEKACRALEEKWPALLIKAAFLKKWKYATPLQIWPRPFEIVQPSLYLAGDAFGGPTVAGALQSSDYLFKELRNNFPSEISL